jgi:hypothetical protein
MVVNSVLALRGWFETAPIGEGRVFRRIDRLAITG